MKRLSILARAGLLMVTLAAFCSTPLTSQAQHEKFTLTNGHLYWLDATSCDDQASSRYPVAFDRNNGGAEVHPSGPINAVTHVTEHGDYYMELDITDPANPTVVARPFGDGFTPKCVWSRTGYTGYYYQEWDNVRYYLVGTRTSLKVVPVPVGDALENATYWYNWDFGAAITEVTFRDGVRKETNHWLYLDTVGLANSVREPIWKMDDVDCYQRPEDIIYYNPAPGATHGWTNNPAVDDLNKSYYYSYEDPVKGWQPYGVGALYLPVEQIDHPVQFDRQNMDTNTGLTALEVTKNGVAQTTMKYGDVFDLNAVITYPNGGTGQLQARVRPSYTEYREETFRCGINLNYRERNSDVFGSAGVPTVMPHYYKNGAPIQSAPTSANWPMTLKKITYTLNSRSRRYLQMYGASNPTTPTFRDTTIVVAAGLNARPAPLYLECSSVPYQGAQATLTAIAEYEFIPEDGLKYVVFDTIQTVINMSTEITKRDDIDPTNAPVIMGYVCGGGRMANVGYVNSHTVGGNPTITVHNTDSIYAMYGGNDIAGWVQGKAIFQVGSLLTRHPMHIGYIYGGGCGYYTYQHPFDAAVAQTAYTESASPDVDASRAAGWAAYTDSYYSDYIRYSQYAFKGAVYPWHYNPSSHTDEENADNWVVQGFDYNPYVGSDFEHQENGQNFVTGKYNGTIPYIKNAEIYIGIPDTTPEYNAATAKLHDDLIMLDTVFGGAENAFIGIDGDGTFPTAISIDVYGGTIMAVFGGNNYGGSVARGAHVYTTVHNTKTSTDLDIVNTHFTGYGRDFGIRHVYGGGNLVESAHAEVRIFGGMTDTCFVGGNQASVVQPVGSIDCRGDKFIYDNPSLDVLNGNDAINLQAATISDNEWNKFLNQNPGAFVSEKGRYNVRVFFGGNNRAPMENLSYIHLTSGGVCYVYGGGNEGDMDNMTPWNSPYYQRWSDGTFGDAQSHADGSRKILDFGDSVRGSFNGWIYEMPTVFGSMVNSPTESRIICENIYGGCRKANVKRSSGLSLSGGVFGYVQGGCDISGDVGSEYENEGTWVIIDSNTIVLQDVYGGSDGYYHCHNATGIYTDADVYNYNLEPNDYYHEFVGLPSPTQNNSNLYIHGGTILYAAYGGGVMCDIGFKEGARPKLYNHVDGTSRDLVPFGGNQNGSIHFLMTAGTIGSAEYHMNAPGNKRGELAAEDRANGDGNAYGGGYLSSLYGLSYFKISSDTITLNTDPNFGHGRMKPTMTHPRIYGSVYAGNDCMGSIANFKRYKLPNGTYDSFVASNNEVLNGTSKALFDAYVLIEGMPHITCVYGSGNGAYDYDGTRPEYSSMEPVCQDGAVDNRPFQSSTFIDIHTAGGFIDTVFGGGNGVGVREDAEVLLNNVTKYNPDRVDSLFVGTIFGGNNRDNMTCVPDIILAQGTVNNVYGGGNAGSMVGYDEFTDLCGNVLSNVSTYVKVETDKVHIANNLFGGCRMADVSGMAYVDVRSTDEKGINYLYGGNDISGSVTGNTRVDISGGYVNHIYGGSNGYYDYYKYTDVHGNDSIVVWTLGAEKTNSKTDVNLVALNSTGSPYVDDATVNLFGGTLRSNVYGGGRLGDCRNTTVVVNDQICSATTTPLTILGEVYGGGEGHWQDLTKTRRGNTGQNTTGTATGSEAVGASTVHLHHAYALQNAKAYGGGKGGNAYNTYVYAYDTWDKPFNAIYGGCWGSDVLGTAHVIMEGTTIDKGTEINNNYTAINVYGGNDFTGNVYASEVTINSGTYGNIYGAGDGYGGIGGESDDGNGGIASAGTYADMYTSGQYDGNKKILTVPNTEYVTINFNSGRVSGNLYGGGKLGTTFSYKKYEADEGIHHAGEYVLDANGYKIIDTTLDAAHAYSDPLRYSYVITNVKSGFFDHNIYAGGSGAFGGKPLIYGLKVLNMEGGEVALSVYGGSANVSDGYAAECKTPSNTTARPSSIVNISGGTVVHHVFGGGYLGTINGSAYINIGVDAINNSNVWTKAVKNTPNAYASFKPTMVASTSHPLNINQSVYGGPNWGNSSGSADFSKPGVFGGETRIFIDGNGYNTGILESDKSKPTLDILGSVIGAGTSADGGDVYNRIDVRNYGGIDESNCKPTRHIEAIQRADAVYLNNTAITYNGTTDAISPYLSNQITLNRIDTLHNIGYNIIDIKYAIVNIGEVNYWKHKEYPYVDLELTQNIDLTKCYTASGSCDACDPEDVDYVCNQLDVLDRTDADKSFTALLINNGVNVDFVYNGVYAAVNGFGYIIAPANTNAIITARPKYSGKNELDGGFLSVCSDSLQARTGWNGNNLWDLTWCRCVLNDAATKTYDGETETSGHCFSSTTQRDLDHYIAEYPYYNYSQSYRVWSLGNGTRRRFAVVQAHSNPDNSDENKKITLRYNDAYGNLPTTIDSVYNLNIAHSVLTLPPTTPGHYYKINGRFGVDLTDENDVMRLIDQSYRPTKWEEYYQSTIPDPYVEDVMHQYYYLTDTNQTPTATTDDDVYLLATSDYIAAHPSETYYERRLKDSWGLVNHTGYNNDSISRVEPAANGNLYSLVMNEENARPTGLNAIYNNPDAYFGLMMTSGKHFATDNNGNLVPPEPYAAMAAAGTWTGSTTLSGNSHVNIVNNFSTAQVGAQANASPELDLYMLYDNRFSHTLIGTVKLELEEYEWAPGRTGGHGTEGTPGYIPAGRLYKIVNGDTVVIADEQDHYLNGYGDGDRHFVEHNLQAPIQVEISLATILEDFTDMEYEVLAMYNEGRSDVFSRKVVLPATLQTREVYLKNITWGPTDNNGNWYTEANNPTNFYMTDSLAVITGNTVTEHNRFGMQINVTDNISNNLTSSVGWFTPVMTTPTSLYTLAGYGRGAQTRIDKKRVTGDEANYYDDGNGHPASVALMANDGLGELLGVLDGRGEAAINVNLNFDGRRIYNNNGGRGYVGKAVLHLVSYNTQTDQAHARPNDFDLTIYVKTRAHGDTMYIASANQVVRNGYTMTPHNSNEAHNSSTGKQPNDYLRSFYDIFTSPAYQEGDVIAVLDEVTIKDGSAVFIKGEEFMPVNIIRYSGHHDKFPGEGSAYRGPMITVTGNETAFSARCIDFNGSMLTKTKPKAEVNSNGDTTLMDGLLPGDKNTPGTWKYNHDAVLEDYTVDENNQVTMTWDKYADTLKAWGPIIRVKDGATVTLQNGVTVERNYNTYNGSDTTMMGAINVGQGGTLELLNNVTIKENVSKKLEGDDQVYPRNGAVFVNNGMIQLLSSTSDETAILIKQNLMVENPLNGSFNFWKVDNINIINHDANAPVHYSMKDGIFDANGDLLEAAKSDFSLANVYLMRLPGTSNTIMDDRRSNMIYMSTAPKAGTSIGISKWFPGPTERDTIQVVYQSTATQLREAVYTNHNFFSDDGYFVFYNYGVNNQRVYLQRCATFNYQHKPAEASELVAGSDIWLDSVLQYIPLADATCPTGGDKIIYRMKGGFYPYTYTWTEWEGAFGGTGNELKTRTSPYTTIETNNQIDVHNYKGLKLATADTLVMNAVPMLHTESEKTVRYTVTASDVTGNCPRTKNVEITLVKDITTPSAQIKPFVKDPKAAWDSDEKPGATAAGRRTYEAVKITPMVWADRSEGTIVAKIKTDEPILKDSIFTDDGTEHHPLEGMAFCEGDVIRLSTSPRVTGSGTSTSQFVMWDFSPFYSNPVSYVVPSKSTAVIAYYRPHDYWVNTITNVDLAKAYYDNNYIYSTKPAGDAGYVTTYHGDVHIYNENGLAWFISVVNGLNGTQARSFYFNNVYLHDKDGGYDMKAHRWTPVGTLQHRFRGGFYGVANTSDSCTQAPFHMDGETKVYDTVVIKNIIVDEPDLEHTGFFAFLDSAVVANIQLEGELIRGAQYVGGLAAKSEHSKIVNVNVQNDTEPNPLAATPVPNPTLTILTTHHTSGGLIGKSYFDSIDDCHVAAKYVGDAVYNGGMVGYGTSIKVYNTGTRNLNRMNAVYSGGVAGYLDGTNIIPSTRRRAKSDNIDKRSFVMNNYVHYVDDARNQRVGGLVGYAKNTVMENNYVYGNLYGSATEGAVGAVLDSGTLANHNYYESSSVSRSVGQLRSNASSTNSTDFSGKGNQVKLSTQDYGVDNLTRVLNIWVRAHGDSFKTWRSDMTDANHGYPLFGTPDMISVSDSLTITGCDSVEWDGVTYLFDDEVVSHVVDSLLMVDSTFTLRVMVNHATREQVEDSVNAGDPYEGYGFQLTDVEVLMLYRTVGRSHSTTIVLNDTLQTAAGCDSIVTLMLTINPRVGIVETTPQNKIKVYPNPTTSRVTIEASESMSHVELYDNRGIRLQDYNTHNSNDITIDVSHYPSGAYYLRVHTADNVTIQKLIKK